MTVFRCTAAYEFSCVERMYGFQCSAISGQRDTACVDPGMWCTVTPARRALSLPQAQELLFAQKHGALYNVQKEQLYAYEDAKKLADAWKYGCQQLLVPKMEGSLYILSLIHI